MKPEYTNLKLIIETPTQEAWDKVTEFFGLDWSAKGFSYNRHAPFTCIRVGKNSLGMTEYSAAYREYFVTDHFNGFDRLTYPEFEARFLNQTKTMSKTLDEIIAGKFTCACGEIYKSRGLIAPDCFLCNEADTIKEIVDEQTAQMKADIVELLEIIKEVDDERLPYWSQKIDDILEKTAHYYI